MRTHGIAPAAAAALILLTGCGGDDAASETTGAAEATQPAPAALELELTPVHDSGQAGTATLTPGEESIDVVLVVAKAEDGQHAHIHDVTCAEYAEIKSFDAALATVTDTLADFADTRSETNVIVLEEGGLAARTTGGYSINVHKKAYPYDVTACGDIPKR